ncbi:MAG: hypothetical protein KDE15_08300 [Erythrobacter sp.]|nr:hypothetical protein [Erythrobacter sp.]
MGWHRRAFAAIVLACTGCAAVPQPVAELPLAQLPADGWVTMAGLAADDIPVVLDFRREFALEQVPSSFPVRVTADNRFVLYVNGQRVASGPSAGNPEHWREARIDLAPYLVAGDNVVAAEVWSAVKPLAIAADATPEDRARAEGAALFTGTAPLFQHSVATGFRLRGEGEAAPISTGAGGWRVARDAGHGFANGWRQIRGWYYVAGNPETIDAATANWDWAGAGEAAGTWQDAAPAPAAAERSLEPDRLPPQRYAPVPAGRVVRSDLPGGEAFPQAPVTIPAHSHVQLLVQRDAMVAAYPQLTVSGGAGAHIDLTWSEALYGTGNIKAERNLIEDRHQVGIHDSFVADGQRRTFAPLWWRTWRYLGIEVQTGDQPLVLEGLAVFETGYPFEQVGQFASNDPQLATIFDIGWRTARIDAHETYMDTAFWEQLQYVGDTRLQMLLSYAVAGDPRLAEQAIDAIAQTRLDNGLVYGAAPSRTGNAIATFSPMWVNMLGDWRMQQPDPAPIRRNLGRMREILGWFDQWQAASGLMRRNPEWNFIDWVGQPSTDRDQFPSYGGAEEESCLTSLVWLGAFRDGALIEQDFGDAANAASYRSTAAEITQGLRQHCWSEARGLFADNPDLDRFSQHANALAILYDVADPAQADAILDRIIQPGGGIDAPEGVTPVSYYFAWYLVRALDHAGRGDEYLQLLDTWRGLLAMGYTTWPEERDTATASTRSDSHAWSAHPTADLLGVVAGIGPGSPGYASLRVAPHLNGLERIEATAATPQGLVTVRYRVQGAMLHAEIERPGDLPGEFVWQGRSYPLDRPRSTFDLPLN